MTGISVIIPTHNRASFLDRSLNSVCRQTLACGEILVIDDGSTDETAQIVTAFTKKCSIPVRYFFQSNRGPASARNIGIQEAKYSIIAFLDSDDHWQKKKLQLQFHELEANPETLISHTGERWYRRGVHLNQKKKHKPQNGDIFRNCLQLCSVGMSTVMARKKLFDKIGLFDERLHCCEDYELWLRASCCFPFLLVDAPLTIKEGGRTDQVSYTHRVGMDKLRIWAMMNLLKNVKLTREQVLMIFQELHQKCTVYGNGCVKHGRLAEGELYTNCANWAEAYINNGFALPVTVPEKLINSLVIE